MREFQPVGRISEFISGRGKMVTVDGRHVALFRLGDEFFAIDNLCLHKAGPLCDGYVDHKDVVTCPWHGWSYEIRTGTLVQDPRVGVSRHDVRIEGEVISVRLTE
ncbi:MAG TPA: nitrite reductase small subunit NirD [Vicinamibacterales bacterium]|nr:nitrite reductase small subunit NirD [Vicinamibacterales bacterium]